jgi:transposase-like protein
LDAVTLPEVNGTPGNSERRITMNMSKNTESAASMEAPARKRGRPKGTTKKAGKAAKSAKVAKATKPAKAAKVAKAAKPAKAGKAAKAGRPAKSAGRPRGSKKANTGKRYSDEEKQKIVDFVGSQGRGGISAACAKYNVSYIALRRWLQGAGVQAGNTKSAGKGAAGDKRLAEGLKKAAVEAKALRLQITALHRLLRTLG